MTMVDGPYKPFHMDGYLYDNLKAIAESLRRDWDCVCVMTGREGAGKSVLMQQCAYVVDPTFTVDRIAFTPQQFMDLVKNAEKYQAIIYDEAYFGLSAEGAMTATNRVLKSMLTEVRQKNLFLGIVLPWIFDLSKYVVLNRASFLIHAEVGENLTRGTFRFYDYNRMHTLYLLNVKTRQMNKPAPNFRGRFVNTYVVDEPAYRQKKYEALMAKEMTRRKVADDRHRERLYVLIKYNLEHGMTKTQIAKLFNLSFRAIEMFIEEFEKDIEARLAISKAGGVLFETDAPNLVIPPIRRTRGKSILYKEEQAPPKQ